MQYKQSLTLASYAYLMYFRLKDRICNFFMEAIILLDINVRAIAFMVLLCMWISC